MIAKEEFNRRIQDLQSLLGDGFKATPIYQSEQLVAATWGYHWDGKYRQVARQERPFMPDSTYHINEDAYREALARGGLR